MGSDPVAVVANSEHCHASVLSPNSIISTPACHYAFIHRRNFNNVFISNVFIFKMLRMTEITQ